MRTIDRIRVHGIHFPPGIPKETEPVDQKVRDLVMLYGEKAALRKLHAERREAVRRLEQTRREFSDAVVGWVEAVAEYDVLVVDNIARYTYRRAETHAYTFEEFPCVALPRPGLWMEWVNATGHERRGAIIAEIPLDHDDAQAPIANARDNGYADVRWVISIRLLMDSGTQILGPIASHRFALNEHGRIVGNYYEYEATFDKEVLGHLDPSRLAAMLVVPLQALAFMHCRNVKVEPVTPPPKLDRRHRRKYGRGLVTYQTVRLDVPRKASGGGTRNLTGETPLHIVDGHFAYYGDHHHDGCPPGHEPHGLLFGKLSGVYWMPSHVRGNPESGENRNTQRDLRVR